MKVLIAYASRRGATEDMAARIARGLEAAGVGAVDIVDLRGPKAAGLDLSAYGAVALGAPAYAGNWPKEALAWARAREAELAAKPLAVFELGLGIEQVSAKTLLPGLCGKAVAVAKLGGEIRWARLNFLERLVIKAISKKSGDQSNVDEAAIEAFIAAVAKAFR